jgi:RNA polymerase sporulation-specific sigma factor
MIRQGDQDALELMFAKYTPLIYKKIMHFNLLYDKDDMHQEGLLMLHKSIQMFDESFNKTFTKFFESNLHRKYISIVSQRARRSEIFNQHIGYIYETNSLDTKSVYTDLYFKEIEKILTKTENLVYTLRELNNYSMQFVMENHGLTEKEIYNAMYRAKQKIKMHFAN